VKTVPITEAVGTVLAHDITRIVRNGFKGPAFKKGHIVQEEDIPGLLDLGKKRLFVFDLADGFLHENDAAGRIAKASAGEGIMFTPPSEGKINLKAGGAGLLKINVEALQQVNAIEEIMFATLHSNQPVNAKQSLAGTRIIPLVIEEKKIEAVERICSKFYPLIEVKPFLPRKVGIITTGSEIYHGRIEDEFTPVVKDKFKELNSQVIRQICVSDEIDMTVKAIDDLIQEGVDLIAITGGMSVDPDDQTPAAIRASGATVATYGAPILPGAMFMLAYLGNVPIVGLPGCVMYYRISIFDLVVPRLLVGERLTRQDISSMGHGGFCADCDECRYPICPFGK